MRSRKKNLFPSVLPPNNQGRSFRGGNNTGKRKNFTGSTAIFVSQSAILPETEKILGFGCNGSAPGIGAGSWQDGRFLCLRKSGWSGKRVIPGKPGIATQKSILRNMGIWLSQTNISARMAIGLVSGFQTSVLHMGRGKKNLGRKKYKS